MKMTPVESSNLAEIGYDSDRKELAVKFKSGGTHHYVGVEPDRHSGLMSAESHGKYFNQNIKGQYEQKKIGDEPSPVAQAKADEPDSLEDAVRRFNAPPERP